MNLIDSNVAIVNYFGPGHRPAPSRPLDESREACL